MSLRIIQASAGTGKTYRLTDEYVSSLLRNGGPSPLEILAATFTNKAADELVEKVKARLISSAAFEEALILQSGYVGTVHSVCGQILQTLSLECGLSPRLHVLPSEQFAPVFSHAIAQALEALSENAEGAAFRLGQTDWISSISQITQLAKTNNLTLEDLRTSCRNSLSSLMNLFPAPLIDRESLDSSLALAVEKAVQFFQDNPDQNKFFTETLAKLRDAQYKISSNSLSWTDWATLSKLECRKVVSAVIQPVLHAASLHPYHPQLRIDLETYLTALFDVSCLAIEQYDAYKIANGLIDFADQESLLLRFLSDPAVRNRIRELIRVILLDEFQDSSPMQLALFLKLAEAVEHSIWVGDEKQAIYGFRGTDPNLVILACEMLKGESRDKFETLQYCYRSRPSIVAFINDFFKDLFLRKPVNHPDATEVKPVRAARSEEPELKSALSCWWLKGKNWETSLDCLANNISRILHEDSGWSVQDVASKALRPIKPTDVAILCRSNERCLAVSNALVLHNIDVASKRLGLMSTPECVLATACLRYLVNRRDTLAIAEIAHLTEPNTDTSADRTTETWMQKWFEKDRENFILQSSHLSGIDRERHRLPHLTPTEALEVAIFAGNVVGVVQTWKALAQRIANLEMLRGAARDFEEICFANRLACTIPGFLSFLKSDLHKDEQAIAVGNAVNVLTYHASKGLEWPCVILLDLDGDGPSNPFGIVVEGAKSGFDLRNPLKDRWIRVWPWPYGNHRNKVFLDEAVIGSPELQDVQVRERAEQQRLLYVGMTRARDYLIFSPRHKDSGCRWLENSVYHADCSSFRIPQTSGLQVIEFSDSQHNIDVVMLSTDAAHDTGARFDSTEEETHWIFDLPLLRKDFPPFRLVPSSLEADRSAAEYGQSVATIFSKLDSIDYKGRLESLGSRIEFIQTEMELLGEAVHNFLSADLFLLSQVKPRAHSSFPVCNNDWLLSTCSTLDITKERERLAAKIIKAWCPGKVSEKDFVMAGNRLLNYLCETFGQFLLRPECPVFGNFDGQRMNGRIDLLVETDSGFIVLDHKTYPGKSDSWIAKAKSHLPQLLLYAEAINRRGQKQVIELIVHMPIIGKVVCFDC